jgi:hypothetical protein
MSNPESNAPRLAQAASQHTDFLLLGTILSSVPVLWHAGCTFSLPPVPSRGLRGPSRFGGPGRPMSPASFKNPFKTGGDGDQPHAFDSRNPRHCPTVSRLK